MRSTVHKENHNIYIRVQLMHTRKVTFQWTKQWRQTPGDCGSRVEHSWGPGDWRPQKVSRSWSCRESCEKGRMHHMVKRPRKEEQQRRSTALCSPFFTSRDRY